MGLSHLGSGQSSSPEINMLGREQDLIFSIVRKEDTAGNYLLRRADVVFNANDESSLMDFYFGVGSSLMLNLLYNVRLVSGMPDHCRCRDRGEIAGFVEEMMRNKASLISI
jgi:hypothetical protein